jgi:hypothetical protein
MSYLSKNDSLDRWRESHSSRVEEPGTFNGFEVTPFEGHKDVKTLISKVVWPVD